MTSNGQNNQVAKDGGVSQIKNARVVIAWDESASRHVYLSNQDVVFSPEGIIQIGGSYTGPCDSVIDGRQFMVMPGLVNIHSHPAAEPINKGLWDEVGGKKLYNSTLYEYLFLLEPDADAARAARQVAVAELLKSGVTTFCDMSPPEDGWVNQLAQSGIRAVVAPMFRSATWSTRNGRTVDYTFDEPLGRENFARALAVIDEARKHPSARIGGMVAPSQIDTCSESLLRDAYQAAEHQNLPFQIHAGQSIVEFLEITRRHGMTPIEYMKNIGILGPRTTVGHGIFLDHHPWVRWPRTDDLGMLAEAGASVAHCPVTFARRGIALQQFGKYRQRGVNIGIGTDTYPHNMLEEMRLATYIARVIEGNPHDTTTEEVFLAATIGGARVLLRDDIGRLAVGCKSDLVLVDCSHPGMQPCYDPLRSLIYSASERAVSHVFVDGHQLVRDGEVLTIDHRSAARAVEDAQKRAVQGIDRRDWAGRKLSELSPPTLSWR